MSPVETDHYMVEMDIVEPFRHYAITWPQAHVRTDTPDLLAVFRASIAETQESEIDAGMNAENLEVHADLAEASFRTLPAD